MAHVYQVICTSTVKTIGHYTNTSNVTKGIVRFFKDEFALKITSPVITDDKFDNRGELNVYIAEKRFYVFIKRYELNSNIKDELGSL